jgi:8-amino-7-oxononanoate synthase
VTVGVDPLGWLADHADGRVAAGLRRQLRPRAADDPLLDLASNDYLGLARHPEVLAGATGALHQWGAGSTGSRLVTGSTELHAELETALADFVGTSAGLVFSSGYLANLAAVTVFAGAGDLVVSDAMSHASLVDACRLSRARVSVVPHADPAAVDAALAAGGWRRALVVTDSLFSVDGDLAPLADLHAVVRRHGAVLVADEAHAIGVVGAGGRGAVHAMGLAGADDIVVTATLSKSLGSQGGVVLGSQAVVDHLVDTARSFIFDTGLAPACAGAALAALRVVIREPDRTAAVRRRAGDLARAAVAAGLSATTPAGAVVSVVLGEPERAVAAAARCAELGVRVGCFRPPSVPPGTSRLRLTSRADLTDDDVARAARALASLQSGDEAGAP